MLGPEQFLPDDPWRPRIRAALESRPCWSMVVDGEARVGRLKGASRLERAEAILACRVVMAQRHHQQLRGPVLSVRLGVDGRRAVVTQAVALDEPPLDAAGAWARQAIRDLHAVLIGLSWFQPDIESLGLPPPLAELLPSWEAIYAALDRRE